MTNVYDLDVAATATFWGSVAVNNGPLLLKGVNIESWMAGAPSASALSALTTRIVAVESASGNYVPASSNAPTRIATLESASASIRLATLETGASATIAASRLPKAVLPANGLITLLTDLTTQVNAIKAALVSAGYATIAP